MAKITENKNETVFSVKKWLGVNEAEEGDTAIKPGEGAVCRNFRITDGGALQKRPGSRNVVVLSQSFKPQVTENEGTLKCYGEARRILELYPRVTAPNYNTLTLEGTKVNAGYESCFDYLGYYFRKAVDPVTGQSFTVETAQLKNMSYTPRIKLGTNEVQLSGQSYSKWNGNQPDYIYAWFIEYDSLIWTGNGYEGTNPRIVNNGDFNAFDGTKYTLLSNTDLPVSFFRSENQGIPTESDFLNAAGNNGHIGKLRWDKSHSSYISVTDSPLWKAWYKVDVWAESVYEWKYNTVGIVPNAGGNTEVKALWSGLVNGREVIVAACNGILWELSYNDGAFERTQCGEINTSGSVELFGFDDKLYVLTGTEYKVWDGEAVLPVTALAPSDPPDLITDGSAARMRCAELYSGGKGTRVFLCGDGTNRIIYSDFDTDGKPKANSFPAGNELFIGEANTPVTALIRHYDRLLCFKADSAWSISASGNGFTVAPMNRMVGCAATGEARLVNNRPRTLDGGAVMEWTSGALAGSYRNAQKISARVKNTLSGFELSELHTFFDKFSGEYYILSADKTAIVNNTVSDAWYIYTGFDAVSMINYRGGVYFGTHDGHVRLLSRKYRDDEGEAISCRWESGAMDIGSEYRFKHVLNLWLGLKREEDAAVEASLITEKGESARRRIEAEADGSVPKTHRAALKSGKASHFKLALTSESATDAATILFADLRCVKAGSAK